MSPAPGDILAFVVGHDVRLYVHSFTVPNGWATAGLVPLALGNCASDTSLVRGAASKCERISKIRVELPLVLGMDRKSLIFRG